MNNKPFVFIRPSTATIFAYILLPFAVSVIINGPVEASPLPVPQPFSYQNESDAVGGSTGAFGKFNFLHEQDTYRINKPVPFLPLVSSDGKIVTKEVPSGSANCAAYKAKCDAFCRDHSTLLIALLIGLGSYFITSIVGVIGLCFNIDLFPSFYLGNSEYHKEMREQKKEYSEMMKRIKQRKK